MDPPSSCLFPSWGYPSAPFVLAFTVSKTDVPETDGAETDDPETDVHETDAPETEAPETDAFFSNKSLKKSFSTNFCPISKKTTSAIPFSQPIEQDAALRPFCYVL